MAPAELRIPMTWPTQNPPRSQRQEELRQGGFRKCDGCGETHHRRGLVERFEVCPQCGHHHKLGADGLARAPARRRRARRVGRPPRADRSARLHRRQAATASASPPRRRRPARARRSRSAAARIDGRPVAYGAFIFAFMGGSMGSVVGEKVTRLFERADASEPARRPAPGVGRRAHAGGHPLADADGEDGRRARAAARGAAAVHQRAAATRRPAASPRASRSSAT